MDAHYYNGPDEREFGLDPDDGTCQNCGADADEPCHWNCDCAHCQRTRLRKAAAEKDDAA